MRRLLLIALLASALPGSAFAGDRELLEARDRYLPSVEARYAATPDGVQARYDAGRDLVEAVHAAGTVRAGLRALRADLLARGRSQVTRAEALDRDAGFRSAAPLAPLPAATVRVGPRRPDATLARRLAAVAARFDGAAGIWVHDLGTGRYAGFEADTHFAAASTVKLGALVAALRASPQPERSPWWYDTRQLGFWSSNLAANRIAARLGYGAVVDALRRLGMTASTYPGPYRATTAYRPPGPHTRVTTARDLGRALYRLHGGAYGSARALAQVGLSRRQAIVGLRVLASAQPVGDNAGLLRPWLRGATVAEKNGWLSDTRTTAAIVYRDGRATVVVVELYRPGVTYAEAKRLGREVLEAAGLR
ncbi:MAG: serine hydrolase [Gaiellaceae bacterium]